MSTTSISNHNQRPADDTATYDGPPHAPASVQPPLMLLSADAAGPSSRRLHIFADAPSAARHIDFWFPPAQRHRVLAFWALPGDPRTDENKGEAESTRATVDSAPPPEIQDHIIVMIRHSQHQDSVYPFSFPDVPAANRFVRDEMRNGLDLRTVGIFWAAYAAVETRPDGSTAITPSTPPLARPHPTTTSSPVVDIEPDPWPEPPPDPIAAYQPPRRPATLNEVIRELVGVLNTG